MHNSILRDNLKIIKDNIDTTCKEHDILPETVTLIAVSKTQPVAFINEVYNAGIRDFGENKVQELIDKFPQMPDDIRWHLIGHLQTNKVKYIIDKVFLIHSVDSIKLAQEISKEATKRNISVSILIQVNVSHEETKYGISELLAIDLIKEVSTFPGIHIRGLMTIAPYTENPEENRLYFRKLKQLSVDIISKSIDNVSMDCLSMGMSGDYKVAIEEGSTYVRVGTSIFGERIYVTA
jgi:PLP dependent protein